MFLHLLKFNVLIELLARAQYFSWLRVITKKHLVQNISPLTGSSEGQKFKFLSMPGFSTIDPDFMALCLYSIEPNLSKR
jgi:hypothetical protein